MTSTKTTEPQRVQRGDTIVCPGDGRQEKVERVTVGQIFTTVRTVRHDHVRRHANPQHTVEVVIEDPS